VLLLFGFFVTSLLPGISEHVWSFGKRTSVLPEGPAMPRASTGSSVGKDPVPMAPAESVVIPTGSVRIPVVFHIVYHTPEENISDAQIKSQIDALNRDYRARNADLANVPAPFKGVVADAHIEFALAEKTPDGKPTTGIVRTPSQSADSSREALRAQSPEWPPAHYLNIWVVAALQQAVVSLSSFPGDSVDGIVLDYRVVGTIGTVLPSFNRGRAAVHEVGHYLGLLHLWGNENNADCRGTDFVDDTPVQKGPHFGVKTLFPAISCNNGPNGDMFMNFMDFGDDAERCMFTRQQVLRMHRVLAGPRKGLAK
jgi:hypothetical protein